MDIEISSPASCPQRAAWPWRDHRSCERARLSVDRSCYRDDSPSTRLHTPGCTRSRGASSAECPNFILVLKSMSESSRPCLASVSPTVRRLNASNRRQARPTACAHHDVCVACAVLLGDPVQGECGPESSAPMAAEPARVSITSTRTILRHAPMGDEAALAHAAPRHGGLLPCSLVHGGSGA